MNLISQNGRRVLYAQLDFIHLKIRRDFGVRSSRIAYWQPLFRYQLNCWSRWTGTVEHLAQPCMDPQPVLAAPAAGAY